MAHFAEIDENNIVLRVLVTDNNDPAGDEGYQWLIDNLGGTWIKTSYNAVDGKRKNPETGEITNEPGFRKNYASIGMQYYEDLDAFIYPQPYPSWILNLDNYQWEAPVPYPIVEEDSDEKYIWDENSTSWLLLPPSN